MSNDLSSYLLKQDNKEVVRTFEESYIRQAVAYFRSLELSDQDIIKFFHKAQLTGADPIRDQIYLIPRKTKINDRWTTIGTIVFSYHFIELCAQRSKKYQGYEIKTGVETVFNPITGTEDKMLVSHCTVTRGGKTYPYSARWSEYVQMKAGVVTTQWATKPYIMLEKCAKAGALRSAFPEWVSGMYAQEEQGAIEREDEIIEAQFKEKQEAQINAEQKEKIEAKAQIIKDSSDIEKKMDEIKEVMAKITEGFSSLDKGLAMRNLLGVNKFDELKKLSLNSLVEKLELVKKEVKKDIVSANEFDIKDVKQVKFRID